jgi:hypothetical protein
MPQRTGEPEKHVIMLRISEDFLQHLRLLHLR